MQQRELQLCSAVLMIRPARFFSNPLTAASNRFQGKAQATHEDQHARAIAEFDALVADLRNADIRVIVVDDTAEPPTPDAIFPNNWLSTHADGRVVLYPMEAANRRTERRLDIIDTLVREHRYAVREVVDLTAHEHNGHYLEGTGSLVLDRVNHMAYACLSSRTHLDPLGDFSQRMDYDVVAFDACDRSGKPVYHTNVLMSVGDDLAVICDAAIKDTKQRHAVLDSLRRGGHEVLSLSFDQMDAFAGNMLTLRTAQAARLIVMSQRARNALTDAQAERLGNNTHIVSTPVDMIEDSAGGSVRCMLAEIHLPHA